MKFDSTGEAGKRGVGIRGYKSAEKERGLKFLTPITGDTASSLQSIVCPSFGGIPLLYRINIYILCI